MQEKVETGLRERKKRATRDAIVAAATELYLADGPARTSVTAIAAAAGVAPRTFFLHFASKEDVLFHHVEEFAATGVARARAADGPWEAVQAGVGAMIDAFTTTGADRLAGLRVELVAAGPPASLAVRLGAVHDDLLVAVCQRFPGADPERCAAHLGAALGAVGAAAVATVRGSAARDSAARDSAARGGAASGGAASGGAASGGAACDSAARGGGPAGTERAMRTALARAGAGFREPEPAA